jgi:hypothetical protein
MDEADTAKNRFDALVDDKISINDFLRKYLLAEYVAALKAYTKDDNVDQETLEAPSVCAFPIPYSEIAHLMG